MMNLQILLSGVGGQGILFATKILSEAALRLGEKVIGSETHGMSQRGGSVTSHLKIGNYRGPLIRRGSADILFCFEKSELLSNLAFLKPGGICYVDAPQLDFIPKNIQRLLREEDIQIRHTDATSLVLAMKAPLVLNIVLIGFAASHDDFALESENVSQVISDISPERFRKMNLKAFEVGLENKLVVNL